MRDEVQRLFEADGGTAVKGASRARRGKIDVTEGNPGL